MLIGETLERLKKIKADGETALIALGRECAVMLSGFEENADRINTISEAFRAIQFFLATESDAVRELRRNKETP